MPKMKTHENIEAALKQLGVEHRAKSAKQEFSDAKAQKIYLAVLNSQTSAAKGSGDNKRGSEYGGAEKQDPLPATVKAELDGLVKQYAADISKIRRKRKQSKFMPMIANRPQKGEENRRILQATTKYRRVRTQLLKRLATRGINSAEAESHLVKAEKRLPIDSITIQLSTS